MYFNDPCILSWFKSYRADEFMDAEAEGSRGAEWLHGHLRRYGDVYYTCMWIKVRIGCQECSYIIFNSIQKWTSMTIIPSHRMLHNWKRRQVKYWIYINFVLSCILGKQTKHKQKGKTLVEFFLKNLRLSPILFSNMSSEPLPIKYSPRAPSVSYAMA